MVAISRNSVPGWLRPRLITPMMAAALGAVLISSGFAQTKPSVDQSLLQIEAVGPRLASLPSLVARVAEAAAADGVRNIPEVQAALQTAAASAFDPAAMENDISAAVAKTADADADPTALAKAAEALSEGRQSAAAQADEGQDPRDGQAITALVEAMASPELAAETAVTEQVMYAALEILTNATAEQLASLSVSALQEESRATLETLRARKMNEKPRPKDVAEAQEKNRLASALAELAPEDLRTLSTFYASEGGKAKRDALIAAYRQASDAANINLLNAYLEQLVTQLKTMGKPQQN